MIPTLRPLSGYEPPDLPERWTTPKPQTTPQLTIPPTRPTTPNLRALLTKLLEVLDGRRPIGQVKSLLANPVYEATLTRLRTKPHGVRYQLYSMHTCWPAETAVELMGRVEAVRAGGRRALAMVARMELTPDGWRCVVFRLLDGRRVI
ncbi:Rv3235 family protein [Kibdelosporangium lantanae]|uniref:Rv3235 family protein n=1 Tax=Kibdelosporangium lantanae TaxID=1497396 RepID=A0ABW3M3E6_9PSEU